MTSEDHNTIFTAPSGEAHIFVFESGDSNPSSSLFDDNPKFEEYIVREPRQGTRIVSICSQTSISPLKISENAFLKLKQAYGLGVELSDLAHSFGHKPRNADAGYGGMTVKESENGIHDMAYLFSYPEVTKVSWTMRQVAVFHRHDPAGFQNLWIFFHSGPDSKAQQQIKSFASQYQHHSSAGCTWNALHSAILSPYLLNWRAYLQFLGSKVDFHVDKVLTLDLGGTSDHWTYDKLLELHDLGDKLLPIPARLQATISTVSKLEELSRKFAAAQRDVDAGFMGLANDAAYYKTRLEGLISGGVILGKKVKDVLDMLEVALSLRTNAKMLDLNNKMLKVNMTMGNVNKQMLRLTNYNFEDNATVKVVTMVTLTYLPASFIATFLGMNLFSFGNIPKEELGFTISKKIWLYFMLAVPLTVLTLGLWYFFSKRAQDRRAQERRKELEEGEGDGLKEEQKQKQIG